MRLANFTPDAVYPVIRCPIHSVVNTNVTTHFWHRLLRLRGFIVGSLSFNSHKNTYSNLVAVFPYRSQPECFQLTLHKAV